MRSQTTPGTTIEVAKGEWRGHQIMDTPGIYGVSSFNDEEKAARDIILAADIIINIVDAIHLERDLFLTQQLIDMGKPVVVALNFYDEMEKAGLQIDVDLLHDLLGVDVLPTSAVHNQGLPQVADAILKARAGRQQPDLHSQLHTMLNQKCRTKNCWPLFLFYERGLPLVLPGLV